MGGPEKCFGRPEVVPDPSSLGSSCSYSASVGSEEQRSRRERSKSLSQLDPDMAAGEVTRIREKLLRTNSRVEKSQLRSFTGAQRLTLLLLALVDFMGFCSMSIMAPFFPKEATQKGLNETVIGLIFSFYALIMFLTSPIFGKILPKVGTKLLFLGGILVVAITNILFGFLVYVEDFTLFTTLCILVRSIEALGACAYSTASYVYVVNSFPQSIGSVLGILETFVGLGMSTGPAIGGFLYTFNLTPGKVGLIFLLFSALYAISSPIWGWCADKVDNHWSMMVIGLFSSTLGLLLLGPCPYIPWLESATSLWLIIVALCILGVSIALTLLPTFRGILTSATDAGHKESLATYSVVAGIWSCLYSLGEVIGPSLGGVLQQYYGFPLMSTVMAAITFVIALITLLYFSTKRPNGREATTSSDSGINESWRGSSSNSDEDCSETTSLLYSRTDHRDYKTYTEDKVQNYGDRRRIDQEAGDIDANQCTDVRGTISITGGGACEV